MGPGEFDDTGPAFTQIVKDYRFLAGVDWRSPQYFALCLGPLQPGLDPLADHCPLELGEDSHHLEKGLSAWCRGVDSLLVQEQVHAVAMNIRKEGDKVLEAATQPVHGPRHDHVEPSSGRVLPQRVECWPVLARLGPADALVAINLDDDPAHAVGDGSQLALLVLSRLMIRRDAGVDGDLLRHGGLL